MESMILMKKKRSSGVCSKFIKQNVDGISPESGSPIFKIYCSHKETCCSM